VDKKEVVDEVDKREARQDLSTMWEYFPERLVSDLWVFERVENSTDHKTGAAVKYKVRKARAQAKT
jgi:hypothetical protein